MSLSCVRVCVACVHRRACTPCLLGVMTSSFLTGKGSLPSLAFSIFYFLGIFFILRLVV